jgi:hypothetical protein
MAGFGAHFFYQRWTSLPEKSTESIGDGSATSPQSSITAPQSYPVRYVPLSASISRTADLPLLQARDVEKIRELAGNQARIRGRVFRVGHSAKSNTYFLNFGPSREALTAVIFASAAELFEKNKLSPKSFDGREVELQGEVKNHPQYGLEVILESPSQIKLVN